MHTKEQRCSTKQKPQFCKHEQEFLIAFFLNHAALWTLLDCAIFCLLYGHGATTVIVYGLNEGGVINYLMECLLLT